VTHSLPRLTLARAAGLHVWDADGRRYLDAVSGAFCVQLGYTRPDLVAAMAAAAERLPFARRAAFENPEALAYERELLLAVGAPFTRAYFTSSGSEAVDLALKLAHRYQHAAGSPERRAFCWRAGHYHGATLGALSVTGFRERRAPYDGMLEAGAGAAAATRGGLAGGGTPAGSGESPAALILETIPAAGLGAVVPAPGELARVRAECDATGALWIADEVLTGFGRVGALFAWQRLGERSEDSGATPDLVVFGKGAGAGFAPLAGVLVADRVAYALDEAPADARFSHHQTYGGNPIACAVGRRVLGALREERICERVRELESPFGGALLPLAENPRVREVRGLGLLRGIHLAAGSGAGPIVAACRARGLLVYGAAGSGESGDFLLLAPPLIAELRDLEWMAAQLRAAIAEA
jgi:adenosylmethionine-8-amino-7-oxononanoate aminotransferase